MRKKSGIKKNLMHSYRLALAGGWGGHNFVNFLADGYVVVVQIKPTVNFHDRCGICSSTRKILLRKYPNGIPDQIDRYKLATNLYYWENARKVPIGGSQDAWGSVYPGFNLLHYDFRYNTQYLLTFSYRFNNAKTRNVNNRARLTSARRGNNLFTGCYL